MIINESSSKNDYVELEIQDPRKFISAIGGLTANTLKEAKDDDVPYYLKGKLDPEEMEAFGRELEMSLHRNKMSAPPTVQEIKKNDNKIKVPWFLAGTLLTHARNYGLRKLVRQNVEDIKSKL